MATLGAPPARLVGPVWRMCWHLAGFSGQGQPGSEPQWQPRRPLSSSVWGSWLGSGGGWWSMKSFSLMCRSALKPGTQLLGSPDYNSKDTILQGQTYYLREKQNVTPCMGRPCKNASNEKKMRRYRVVSQASGISSELTQILVTTMTIIIITTLNRKWARNHDKLTLFSLTTIHAFHLLMN